MHRILAAAAAVLFATAGVSTWRDRVKAIQSDNAAQQAKLNLTREKLYAQYPTPEVHFEGDELTLGCGQSAPVNLAGNYPKGTQFVLHTDDAKYENGRITVAKDALPGPLELEAITPVSGASVFTKVGSIDAKLSLKLLYEDGWSAQVESGESGYIANFSKGSAKRSVPVEVDSQPGELRLNVQVSAEQQKLVQEQVGGIQEMVNDPEFQAAQKKMQACEGVAKDSQMTCLQNAMKDMQAVSEKLKAKSEAQQASIKTRAPHEAWACNEVHLTGGKGALTGTARCESTDTKLKVTASYTCAR